MRFSVYSSIPVESRIPQSGHRILLSNDEDDGCVEDVVIFGRIRSDKRGHDTFQFWLNKEDAIKLQSYLNHVL